MAMVSMPGLATEKFAFTVWNDEVAEQINTLMGRLVTLHYEQKVGLPSSCFGDSRYYVTRARAIEKIRLASGVVVPVVVGSAVEVRQRLAWVRRATYGRTLLAWHCCS
jgi:hypothetical protein